VAAVTKNRLEAFSDGVFAIAITLLVIELHPPEVGEGESLAHALLGEWPSYVAYLVSFLTIGVIWLNHHRVFTQVVQVDGPLLVLNLVVLLWTALIPFPTAVVAEFLGEGGEHARTAVALYSAVFVLLGLSFGGLFLWITRDDRLLHRLPPPEVVRAARLRFTVGNAVYVVALALSFVWPPLALALHAAMALYYAFDQASVPAPSAPEEGRPSRRPA
jgi:TMEM175 potassium channel family protein